MLKTCKVCGCQKEAVQGVWVMKHGKPEGRTCLACHNIRTRLQYQQLVTLDTGEVLTYAAAQYRKPVTLPTGEVVTYGIVQNRKTRSTAEGRQKMNAAAVKSQVARYQTDAWFRLKKQLANETRRLLKNLAKGRGTNIACFKIFGKSRETVYACIDAQLQARGFKWENHGDEWVLDHRKPLAMAQSSIELYQLCLLENTQVLTPLENASKRVEDQKLIREFEARQV